MKNEKFPPKADPPLAEKINSGFTLVETLASMGILVVFLTATLVSFNATQNLSETTQQQSAVLQAAKAKLEEMRARDFKQILSWYNTDAGSDGIYENRAFEIKDSYGNKYGTGSISLIDVYNNNDDPNDAVDDTVYPDWARVNPLAPWGTRSGHALTVFNGKIWVLGGYGGSGAEFNDVWCSEDGVTWIQVDTSASPEMWAPRQSHAAAVFDNKIWVLGGWAFIGGQYFSDAWYSADGAIWAKATGSAAWGKRFGVKSVSFNNKIWVLGGYAPAPGSARFNDAWYSEDGVSWSLANGAAWGAGGGRGQHGAVVFNNKIWILGGYNNSNNYLNDIWNSSDGATWIKVTNNAPWSQRGQSGAVVHDGKMWIFAGGNSVGQLKDMWYSKNGTAWTQVFDVPWGPRNGSDSVVFGGKIWVLGGFLNSGQRFGDVWWAYGADRMYQADVVIAWRERNSRIIGEDNGKQGQAGEDPARALNGVLDNWGAGTDTEDANGNGVLDSPIHLTGLIANRGYPSQVYLGRE